MTNVIDTDLSRIGPYLDSLEPQFDCLSEGDSRIGLAKVIVNDSSYQLAVVSGKTYEIIADNPPETRFTGYMVSRTGHDYPVIQMKTKNYLTVDNDYPAFFALENTRPGDKIIKDSVHVEFRISPRLNWTFSNQSRLYFAYNGEYGFYDGTWKSGPVISRLQNPELMFTFDFSTWNALKWWKPSTWDFPLDGGHSWHNNNPFRVKIGFAHESNGMFLSSQNDVNAFKKLYSDSLPWDNFTSMGWNYGQLELKFAHPFGDENSPRLVVYLSGRWYVSQDCFLVNGCSASQLLGTDLEDRVFYDSTKSGARYKDYDGLRLLAIYYYDYERMNYVSGNLQRGYFLGRGLFDSHYKYVLKIRHEILRFPLIAYVGGGYGKDLAAYPYRFFTYGIGFELHAR